MFSINKLVIFAILSFAVLVYSVPVSHKQHGHIHRAHNSIKRRPSNEGSCRPKKHSSTDATEPTPVSSHNAGNYDAEPTTTSKSSKPASSSAAPSASPSSDSGDDDDDDDDDSGAGASGSLLRSLFPNGDSDRSWSTAKGSKNFLELSDDSLGAFNIMKELSHDYVTEHGKSAVKAKYPKGSYVLSKNPKGGFSFYGKGPKDVDLSNAKEVTFGYSVYFPEDFDWVKGGKMPGLYGGNSEDGSVSCSGGSRSDECFSVRLMWRGESAGEMYTYLPPSFDANNRVCNVAPESDCNPTYGASVGRGAFNFKAGDWTTVSMRVLLNDENQENGEIELFAEGKSVIKADGLVLRDGGAGIFRGMMYQTFFGGGSTDFATPRDQEVLFADFSTDVTKTF